MRKVKTLGERFVTLFYDHMLVPSNTWNHLKAKQTRIILAMKLQCIVGRYRQATIYVETGCSKKERSSPSGNWTRVTRVTGGYTNHYTNEELRHLQPTIPYSSKQNTFTTHHTTHNYAIHKSNNRSIQTTTTHVYTMLQSP
jgi:hypothetical protein